MASTNSNETDWTLCCLCYSKKNEALMSVTEQVRDSSTKAINWAITMALNVVAGGSSEDILTVNTPERSE